MHVCKLCKAEYQGEQCPYCGYREPADQPTAQKEVKKSSPLVNGCLCVIAIVMILGLTIFLMLSFNAFQRL